jgi:hypothetical protein
MARPPHRPSAGTLSPSLHDMQAGMQESMEAIIVRLAQWPSPVATPCPAEHVPTGLLVWQRLKSNGRTRH